ncbi:MULTISPECIES: hypothetical protein [unclassified Adlercreutzia]|uniref:hypothetical protein n=1 Tax=unclassified Adlercreutzia TaxID=2636013 RepID=UPI0013ED94AA|nr:MULTISPECIES: hypothetical protein [unclassified Adlercreutzia]
MADLRLDQRQLCDIQGRLFERAREQGYDCPAFIAAFMNSNVARRMDETFDFLQWAGEEYLLEELNDEVGGLSFAGSIWGSEPMYWSGYLYRFWHYLTGETSRDIYATADAETMGGAYLGMHTLDAEMAIENLKELSLLREHPC